MVSLLIRQLQEFVVRGMAPNQLGSAVAATLELAAILGIRKNNMRPMGHYCRC